MTQGIQQHAIDQFFELPPEAQSAVIDAGPLEDARDPTAVLIARMAKARAGQPQKQQHPMKPGDWKCPACGDHNFMRNPVCRKCGSHRAEGAGPMNLHESAPGGNAMSVVDIYLSENNIEPRAADNFRALPAQMQQLVMESGTFADARDATAVLITRMNKAKQGILQPAKILPGDWKCSACGEHNYARNQACRKCGTSQELGGSPFSVISSKVLPEKDMGAIEAFLAENGIEAHAGETFRGLQSHLQKLCMAAGALKDARDPTAVLISRMNKARQGTLQPVHSMPGDWQCPACGDHNFARNSTCRKCGTAQTV